MKPILVQQKSNGTLWWAVDWKIWIDFDQHPQLRDRMHKVYTLIPADDRNGRGSRKDLAGQYTFISN